MHLALFGINDSSLNLAVNLLVLMLAVVYVALIYWTYADAKRRISDPVLVTTATAAAFFPFIGTVVYAILRPPEFLEDARERELETRAAELRLRRLSESSCPRCEHPTELSWLRCPECQHRLKDPCGSCGRPVDPRWAICPHCETAVARREQAQPVQNAALRQTRREPRPATKPRAESPSAAQRRSQQRSEAAARTSKSSSRKTRTSSQRSKLPAEADGASGAQRSKPSGGGATPESGSERPRRRPRSTT